MLTYVFYPITSDLVLEHSLFQRGIHIPIEDYLVSFRLQTEQFAFHSISVYNFANLFSTVF